LVPLPKSLVITEILLPSKTKRLVKQLARQAGITEQIFYPSKNKFGKMKISDGKKLRALEEENRRSKAMVADLLLGDSTKTVTTNAHNNLISKSLVDPHTFDTQFRLECEGKF
jgi:hypothetical protein